MKFKRRYLNIGYRSEVAIRCEAKAYERFAEVINDEKMDNITPDKILHDNETDNYCLYWDWYKWYEEYLGVSAIIKVMDALDKEHNCDSSNDKLGYRFMRLGEDDSDVETRENTYNLELWMIRKIDIPDWDRID